MHTDDLIYVAVVSGGKKIFSGHLLVGESRARPSKSTDKTFADLPKCVLEAIAKMPARQTSAIVSSGAIIYSISISRYE